MRLILAIALAFTVSACAGGSSNELPQCTIDGATCAIGASCQRTNPEGMSQTCQCFDAGNRGDWLCSSLDVVSGEGD